MKLLKPYISGSLILVLFLQSCSSISDDAFAHAIKRGDHNQTMRLMQPHHGKLQVQEVNGKWYNPLQYAIAGNDAKASFALLDRGAPTSFDGRSLAYNAARVQNYNLAAEFVANGYGSQADINQARYDTEAARKSQAQANAAALAIGIIFVAALLSSSSNGSSSSSSSRNDDVSAHYLQQNAAAQAAGLRPPNMGM